MDKVTLIIIYNHRFDKNIEILENIYKNKFSIIYHLVPFYDGNKTNVIPVYENSFYFQGYVAQGYKHFFKEEFDHYIFVADDLLLNPILNELNYREHFNLSDNTSFLPGFIQLHKQRLNRFWPRVKEAFFYNINQRGIEASKEIPVYDEALKAFLKLGLKIEPLYFYQIWSKPALSKKLFRPKVAIKYFQWFYLLLVTRLLKKRYNLSYPLVGSYSDIFIISSNTIERFCHYCGVFSATNLHAEVAIPSALALATGKIVTEHDLKLRGKALWPDGWQRLNGDINPAKGDYEELAQYNYQLKRLLDNFPENYIYLHPVKLSEWDTRI